MATTLLGPIARFSVIAITLAALALATMAIARATYWSGYPSYNGCTTFASANADAEIWGDDASSYHDDYLGCATNVATKIQAYYDGSWHDTGWDIAPAIAFAYDSDDDIHQARGNNQIETGTGNWSGFFYSSFVVPS